MASKWRKLKQALGLNLCPRNRLAANSEDTLYQRRSDAALLSPLSDGYSSAPSTPLSNTTKLSKTLSRSSSKKTCSICLSPMRRGDGQAIFTAECSHAFHFYCIASSVNHGNQTCPVCRAKWKEIPSQAPNLRSSPSHGRRRLNLPQNNDFMTVLRRLPSASSNSTQAPPEPSTFDDDEPLNQETDAVGKPSSVDCGDERRRVSIKTYTEVSSVPMSSSLDSFDVLLHLKAPRSNSWLNPEKHEADLPEASQTRRAPIDLVTVLDISGSMAGTKLALLKRAMGFVIQNLSPNDRLSVIAFSSAARRLFPLRKMSEDGKQQALQSVNALIASGGTNIAEGLRKGAKIMEDRREKNSVSSIILLSDGQDTYSAVTNNNTVNGQHRTNYEVLLPSFIREAPGFKIPVHTFGFGVDHDASLMHFVSEFSGGTFSFIEAEGVIQDAFAQCIGGLLSVVVKDLRVKIECVHPNIGLKSLKVGSYPNRVLSNRRSGVIDVGDLYADEERDFLVSVNVPFEDSSHETLLLTVSCSYGDPLGKEAMDSEDVIVKIIRTTTAQLSVKENVSIEVNRQQNRSKAAEAMSQARTLAENGDLAGAVSVLGNFRKLLSQTVSAKSEDGLCVMLDEELKEMQERMKSRQVYESSGRAYVLSGLSSHSWQRATARGDSIDGSSLVRAYQTPSMAEMVTRSQAALLGSASTQRVLRPTWSFGSRARPR